MLFLGTGGGASILLGAKAHREQGHRLERCAPIPPESSRLAPCGGEGMRLAIRPGHSAGPLPLTPCSWSVGRWGPGFLGEGRIANRRIGREEGEEEGEMPPPGGAWKLSLGKIGQPQAPPALLGLWQPYLPGCGAEAHPPAWKAHPTPNQFLLLGWEQQKFGLEREGPV